MPNHVINELNFREVDAAQQGAILAKLCNDDGKVDFEVLVPTPPNVWLGNVGRRHEKLGFNGLDWSRQNWGTKWNAYGQDRTEYSNIVQDGDTLTVRFQTAWQPPYGWLVAVFNSLKVSFEHDWLDEGRDKGFHAVWNYEALVRDDVFSEPWQEDECSDEIQRHLHKLLWGVEQFDDEDDSETET